MALHESLRELVAARGAGVTADAAELRAAMDDFLSDDEVTLGELNLLTDAVRLGAVQRLLELLDHGADPERAVHDAGAALARDRGTDDVRRSGWAVAVLGYALGRLPVPTAYGAPDRPVRFEEGIATVEDEQARPPRGEAVAAGPEVAPTPAPRPVAPPPRGRRPAAAVRGRTRLVIAAVCLVAAVAGVSIALVWPRADEPSERGTGPTDGTPSTPSTSVLPDHELVVGGALDGDSRIFRVDSTTGEVEQLTPGVDHRHPNVSPDRSTLVYVEGEPTDGPFTAARLDLRTGTTGLLFPADGPCRNSLRPSWSPSGERLAVVCTGDDEVPEGLYVADADGDGLRLVAPGSLFRGTPAWVSEETLVYARWEAVPEEEPSALWSVTVPDTKAAQPPPARFAVDVGRTDVTVAHPDWSPRNERLLFMVRTHVEAEGGVLVPTDGEVWTANADGTEPRLLTSGPYDSPAWSPDGTRYAVVRLTGDGYSDIAVADYPAEPGQRPVPLRMSERRRFFSPAWDSR